MESFAADNGTVFMFSPDLTLDFEIEGPDGRKFSINAEDLVQFFEYWRQTYGNDEEEEE